MMEPVAWRLRWVYPATGQATSWAATTDKLVADQKERDGLEVEPLVPASRLSDAEARIAELEATVKAREAGLRTQVANHTEALRHAANWQARAEAAEALLKEAREALEPFARVAERDISEDEFDDDVFRPMPGQYARAQLINVGHLRAARAISDKIGVNDE